MASFTSTSTTTRAKGNQTNYVGSGALPVSYSLRQDWLLPAGVDAVPVTCCTCHLYTLLQLKVPSTVNRLTPGGKRRRVRLQERQRAHPSWLR